MRGEREGRRPQGVAGERGEEKRERRERDECGYDKRSSKSFSAHSTSCKILAGEGWARGTFEGRVFRITVIIRIRINT